jgi:hypothetical protein
MKRYTTILLSLILAASFAQAVSARGGSAFDRLKALAGEWECKTPDGQVVRVLYQVISGGSAVMETIKDGTEVGMITIYHPDGDALMMTHYCSIGNQPRMRAVQPAGELKSLKFTFVDATNLSKSTDGRMQGLTMTFVDKDHLKHEWTSVAGGKEETVVSDLERKK